MRRHNWIGSLIVLVGVAGGQSLASAQAQSGVKAEIQEIKKTIQELQQATVSLPTLSQAVAQLSSKLVSLQQQVSAAERAKDSSSEAIEKLDALEEKLGLLRTEVEYLRTGIANIEQPAAQSSGSGSATHNQGMEISTADGRYAMTIGGFMHGRYELQVPGDFSGVDVSTFRIRRARLVLKGQLGDKGLRYAMSSEFGIDAAPLLDYYLDWDYKKEVTVRFGQTKLPYSRSLITSSADRVFHELSLSQDLQRYGRDTGVWLLGSVWDNRIHYHGGISNGSDRNQSNANIDMAAGLRVEGALVGDYIAPSHGDVKGTEKLAVTVGAAIVHDLVEITDVVSGIEVGNLDVDANGINDNIRVISTAFDAQLRHKGLDLVIEATWRHERWGTILDRGIAENRDLSDAVGASVAGHRNYLGITAEASYFVLPHKLLVGARVSHGRLPVLGLGGRTFSAIPRADRALQFDGIVQLYREGKRSIGMSYGLTNFNEKDGPDPDNDILHTVIVEAQLSL